MYAIPRFALNRAAFASQIQVREPRFLQPFARVYVEEALCSRTSLALTGALAHILLRSSPPNSCLNADISDAIIVIAIVGRMRRVEGV